MNIKTRDLVQAAVLAALYVALGLLQNLLLPGSTSMAIQFRAAEALCVFAVFTPAAILGLPLGCMIFNLTSAGTLPLDPVIGTAATFFAALLMYLLRKVRIKNYPLVSMLMPALWNGLLVGLELTIYLKELPLWLNILYVAIGEVAVLLVLGTALYYAMTVRELDKRLFGR